MQRRAGAAARLRCGREESGLGRQRRFSVHHDHVDVAIVGRYRRGYPMACAAGAEGGELVVRSLALEEHLVVCD